MHLEINIYIDLLIVQFLSCYVCQVKVWISFKISDSVNENKISIHLSSTSTTIYIQYTSIHNLSPRIFKNRPSTIPMDSEFQAFRSKNLIPMKSFSARSSQFNGIVYPNEAFEFP